MLSGAWDLMPVDTLGPTPPAGGWQSTTVPNAAWGGWSGKQHSAWYRRAFACPAELGQQRLVLHFDAVAHACEVMVNGTRVGTHLGGFEPFSFDITGAVRPGQSNELCVGVTDWTAGLKPGVPIPEDPEQLPAGCMLIPFGTRAASVRGIWQDVSLEARAPVHVEGTKIATSVKDGTLDVDLTLRNDGPDGQTVRIAPQVLDAGSRVFALEPREATVPGGQQATFHWQRSGPMLGSGGHSDPHLYDLRTEVRQGEALTDLHHTRFGFRDFTIDGTDYRLNGRVFRLRGLVCAPRPESPEATRRYLLDGMQQANFTMVRHHMFPRPRYFYDIADEVGMCLKDESAFYCAAGSYALTDDAFWANMRANIEAMVRRAWNHPSLCIWTKTDTPAGGQHARHRARTTSGRLIAQLDPTTGRARAMATRRAAPPQLTSTTPGVQLP